MLDRQDHSNIKFNRVNETIGKEVSSLPLSLSHFFHKLIVRHLNYVINLLSYVMVFRLKDWTFASALPDVSKNINAIVAGSISKNTIIIIVNIKSSIHECT